MNKPETLHSFAIPGEVRLLYLVYFIYFFCGMTQSFESVILPELKEYFHLGYQQQMYVVTAKSIPFVFCPLLALFIQRNGYVRVFAVVMLMVFQSVFVWARPLMDGSARGSIGWAVPSNRTCPRARCGACWPWA